MSVEVYDNGRFLVESSRIPGQHYIVDFSNPLLPVCSCRHGETRKRGERALCRHVKQCVLYIRRIKSRRIK